MSEKIEYLRQMGFEVIVIRADVLRIDRQLQTETMFDTIDEMSDETFKSEMRVERSTANYLIEQFAQHKLPKRQQISVKNTIYLYLYFIGQNITMKKVGILFGLTKPTVYKAIRRVISWLLSISPKYIKWPQGEALKMTTEKFYTREKIPNIIGVISCAYIPLKAPQLGKLGCLDKNYSLTIQNIVDADNMFIDIYMGEPGFLQETNVLKRSYIFKDAEKDPSMKFPETTFLLGNLSYSDINWIMSPYENHGFLSNAQIKFNKIHLKTRESGEKTFELLKKRFRVLSKSTEIKGLEHIISLVGSICVLHNICVTLRDFYENENGQNNNEISDKSLALVNFEQEKYLSRRDQLFNHLYQNNIL